MLQGRTAVAVRAGVRRILSVGHARMPTCCEQREPGRGVKNVRRFRIVFRPATGRRLVEDVDADDVRTEGVFLVFRRDVLVLRSPRTVVALRVPAAAVARVESRCRLPL